MLDDDDLMLGVTRPIGRGGHLPPEAEARLTRQLTQRALAGGLLVSRGGSADHIVDSLVTMAGQDELAMRRACVLVTHLARTSPPDDPVHAAQALLRTAESRMAWVHDQVGAI